MFRSSYEHWCNRDRRVTQRVPEMAGTATTEERWEVPLRAALFLPADF
jgi:hypothetical protein